MCEFTYIYIFIYYTYICILFDQMFIFVSVVWKTIQLGLSPEFVFFKSFNTLMQVQNVTAAYIMKCDDDTFVRVDTVLKEIEGISSKKSLYMGNLNLLHRPLRSGKWAVTYEVCKLA